MTNVTQTLTDFLLARIAEDEARATGFAEERGEWMHIALIGEGKSRPLTSCTRVLAECEAKRRIVAVCDDYEEPAPTVLRLLALPYADHPDYREEWKV